MGRQLCSYPEEAGTAAAELAEPEKGPGAKALAGLRRTARECGGREKGQ